MGWSSRTQGYLSEGALVTAMVLFRILAGRDPLEPTPRPKSCLQTDLKRAAKGLGRLFPDVAAAIASVEIADFAND
jgi:hypothetical protein